MLRQRCPEMAADNTPLDERVIFCIGEGASNAQSEEILGVELAHIRKLRKQLQRAQKRTPLKERLDERRRFRGTFVRYGSKPAFRGPDQRTILLESVADVETGEIVADHLWFNLTKGFAALGTLIEGDVVGFDARVKSYLKGYRGYREDVYKPVEQDYKLSHPTKIEKVRTTDG